MRAEQSVRRYHLVSPPRSHAAPSVNPTQEPSQEMTTKRTRPKCRMCNTEKPCLVGSSILSWKYTPNENITLTAEVTKLLPGVFDTGDPVPCEA